MSLCLALPHISTICDGKADYANVAQRFPQVSKFKPITTCPHTNCFYSHEGINIIADFSQLCDRVTLFSRGKGEFWSVKMAKIEERRS